MKTRKMARLTTLGFLGSIALHGAAYASLGLAPKRGSEGRPPASVMFEVEEPAPKVAEPEPEPTPPPPPDQEQKVAVARPAAAPPPPPVAAPPPPTAAAPVDLSGLTLTNGVGEGGWAPMGDGSSRGGPIGPIGPKAKPAAVVPVATSKPALIPAAGEPGLVSSRDLSERPRPPALDGALKNYYPPEARNRAISGTASLRVRIEPNGRVKTASILSESFSGFGAACQKALLGSVWSPPRDQSGRAVATEVRYTCRFVIE
jgi:TonB family protein